ncbi:hypothetical protein CSOJ01_11268 [Colletotrichum sojae]|uniref:Uncharacterized protein n=1 Tax=Colletotrichum sojae TaxID=2175907 RepID=A0A8H6IYU5_9PEZI|nr:hypothetical protein CSOJ01_11268 [Colletotrichum sojae]
MPGLLNYVLGIKSQQTGGAKAVPRQFDAHKSSRNAIVGQAICMFSGCAYRLSLPRQACESPATARPEPDRRRLLCGHIAFEVDVCARQ